MTIKIPDSARDVEARSKADVQRELSQSNPFLKNSWLGAIVTASAFRIYDLYLQLTAAIVQNFPDTATGEWLIRWAAIWGKQLLPASRSNGSVVATGVAGSTVPLGTVLTVSGIGSFVTTAAATINQSSVSVNSLIRVGTTVTATATSDHGLANGVSVSITGASDSIYNITANVIVVGLDTFQYEVVGSPANEPAATALAEFTTGSIEVTSEEFGSGFNLDAGTQLKLQSPIVGVDDTLTVDFGAVGGGTDEESESSLRSRMLDRIQNPIAHFNEAAIVEQAKTVPGVTRVFTYPITPDVGQVTIYFMRDGDPNPIPTGSEVTKVKDAILEITPLNTDPVDVIVLSPVAVPVAFAFSSLVPNTSTMQQAVTANLRQFFDEGTAVGVDVDEDAYRSAIFNTVDTVTGDSVSTFTLSAPPGDITIADGEIGTLSTVTYS